MENRELLVRMYFNTDIMQIMQNFHQNKKKYQWFSDHINEHTPKEPESRYQGGPATLMIYITYFVTAPSWRPLWFVFNQYKI